MRKIGQQVGDSPQRDKSIAKFFLRQLIYIAAGVALYFSVSWLSFTTSQPGFRNVTFRPASVILVLFGVLFGPWVGLLTGVIGKTLADVVAGWGFYWNGSVAYGLLGLIAGFGNISFKELLYPIHILRAILWGALGVFLAASFFSVSAAYLGDVHLTTVFPAFFWPEFAGNLIVVILLLPLLMLAISVIKRKWKS